MTVKKEPMVFFNLQPSAGWKMFSRNVELTDLIYGTCKHSNNGGISMSKTWREIADPAVHRDFITNRVEDGVSIEKPRDNLIKKWG